MTGIDLFRDGLLGEDTLVGICPICGESITYGSFKDELSKKEFLISGLCQKCQDYVFEEE